MVLKEAKIMEVIQVVTTTETKADARRLPAQSSKSA